MIYRICEKLDGNCRRQPLIRRLCLLQIKSSVDYFLRQFCIKQVELRH